MLKIGLSGGIGAGKSTVVQAFAEQGAYIIDSDALAREVVAPGSVGLEKIVACFGSHIIDASGALDRKALAAEVFHNSTARETLNAITHPLIAARTAELIQQAPTDSIIIQDTPLLVELNMGALYNLVIIVDAPLEQRIARLMTTRGMSQDEVMSRIASQTSEEQRRKAADIWIENSGTKESLYARALDIYYHYLIPCKNALVEKHLPAYVPAITYNPAWDQRAKRTISRLWYIFSSISESQIERIDHIGSTSIPHFPAKDIIDIQITVTNWEKIIEIIQHLEVGGFIYHPNLKDKPQDITVGTGNISFDMSIPQWDKYFFTSADPINRVHVHIRLKNTASWFFALLFPQYVQNHSDIKEEYIQLKIVSLLSDNYAQTKDILFSSHFSLSTIMEWAETAQLLP